MTPENLLLEGQNVFRYHRVSRSPFENMHSCLPLEHVTAVLDQDIGVEWWQHLQTSSFTMPQILCAFSIATVWQRVA